MEAAAGPLGLRFQAFDVSDVADLDAALSAVAKSLPGVVILAASPFFSVHRRKIVEFTRPRKIPTVAYERQFVQDGVLMSYGPSIAEAYRRGAAYADKILKGARPADLPVEQPTRLEPIVNLRTAKALGLTIPPSLLLRADQVIE